MVALEAFKASLSLILRYDHIDCLKMCVNSECEDLVNSYQLNREAQKHIINKRKKGNEH